MNRNTLIINGILFQTGDKITCNIHGFDIQDAKIYISYVRGGAMKCYLCQNEINGNTSPDLLGYKYSYEVIIPVIHNHYDNCDIKKVYNNVLDNIIELSYPKR